MKRFLLATALALAAAAPQAAPDPARFQLTPALLQKLKAAEADYKKQAPAARDEEADAQVRR